MMVPDSVVVPLAVVASSAPATYYSESIAGRAGPRSRKGRHYRPFRGRSRWQAARPGPECRPRGRCRSTGRLSCRRRRRAPDSIRLWGSWHRHRFIHTSPEVPGDGHQTRFAAVNMYRRKTAPTSCIFFEIFAEELPRCQADTGAAGGDQAVAVVAEQRVLGTQLQRLEAPDVAMARGVAALTVYAHGNGEALYVAGGLTMAGGVAVNGIARWDGTAWSALSPRAGAGTNHSVHALAVYDDGSGEALYAGGWFTTAGTVAVNQIARWDGTAWSALSGPAGTGTDGPVYALAVVDDGTGEALYAGGEFTTAGGLPVNTIAKWDGAAWSPLVGPAGPGTDGPVLALAGYDQGGGEALYAGGFFNVAGGEPVDHVARWDGTAWSAVRGPDDWGPNGRVHALAVYDDGNGEALYAGGWFDSAGPPGMAAGGLARWDDTGWTGIDVDRDGGVEALAVYDDGNGPGLYLGGNFTLLTDGLT
ncbi:MAG: hypothetical protein GY835_22150, partial [bacterium]|nr:hypothetical protein [bacterium]